MRVPTCADVWGWDAGLQAHPHGRDFPPRLKRSRRRCISPRARRTRMNDTATETMDTPGVEKHGFGAEVGRLLDLVVHSLYSEREIFLRELVANAADAVDRRRFEALTDPALALPDGAKVRIVPDKAA